MLPSDGAAPQGSGNVASGMGARRYEWFLSVFLTLLIAHSFYVLILGLRQPISDAHEFRQTQTALTAYWLWRGGPWLHYETPVLGAPWSIPLEFPFYQGLVAILRWYQIPINVGGRLVSYMFYIGLLVPLGVLFRSLNLGRIPFFFCAVLLMSSPIYLFWSRTVMIELCALFFGFVWLAWLVRFAVRPHIWDFIVAAAAGIIALTVKGTTFTGFGLLGGLVFLQNARRFYSMGLTKARLTTLALIATAAIVPLMCAAAWGAYAVDIGIKNPIFYYFLTNGFQHWNFGTWTQRISGELWTDILLHRMLPHVLGFSMVISIAVIFVAFCSRKIAWFCVVSILAFFTPILIFTNLHLEHDYYQAENGLFVLAAVSFGIFAVFRSGEKWLSLVILVVISVGQLVYFHMTYAAIVSYDYSHELSLELASLVKQNTSPSEGILVLGQDWSSAMPYYSERKALVLPFWTPAVLLEDVFAHSQTYFDKERLGAIVVCLDKLSYYRADAATEIRMAIRGLPVLGQIAGCEIISANSASGVISGGGGQKPDREPERRP